MRAVIFANGELEKPDLLANQIRPDDFFIAADGGLQHIRTMNLKPDLLVGDLDSVSPADLNWLQAHRVEILKYPPDKNFTDLELAIREALKRGFSEILIAGGLGGRFDQTLANLYLLALPELNKCKASLDDGVTEIYLIRGSHLIEGHAGDTVSLIPLGLQVTGVKTDRLKYPLNSESLLPSQTRGISNIMLADTAQVEIETGTLLCIHIRMQI